MRTDEEMFEEMILLLFHNGEDSACMRIIEVYAKLFPSDS